MHDVLDSMYMCPKSWFVELRVVRSFHLSAFAVILFYDVKQVHQFELIVLEFCVTWLQVQQHAGWKISQTGRHATGTDPDQLSPDRGQGPFGFFRFFLVQTSSNLGRFCRFSQLRTARWTPSAMARSSWSQASSASSRTSKWARRSWWWPRRARPVVNEVRVWNSFPKKP